MEQFVVLVEAGLQSVGVMITDRESGSRNQHVLPTVTQEDGKGGDSPADIEALESLEKIRDLENTIQSLKEGNTELKRRIQKESGQPAAVDGDQSSGQDTSGL